MDTIDFTAWTDAQLEVGRRFAPNAPHSTELMIEIAHRQAAGTWMTDGSVERVALLRKAGRRNRKGVRR